LPHAQSHLVKVGGPWKTGHNGFCCYQLRYSLATCCRSPSQQFHQCCEFSMLNCRIAGSYLCVDQGQNGRVISPGYTDDPSGTLSQTEEQPPAHVIGDNVQASVCC